MPERMDSLTHARILLSNAAAILKRRKSDVDVDTQRMEDARSRLDEAIAALDEVRSEEHTSELQSLMRISYAVFCLKKKTNNTKYTNKQSKNVKKDHTQ